MRIYRPMLLIGSVLLLAVLACNFSLSDTGFIEPAAQRDTEEAEFNRWVLTEDARCAGLTSEECDNLEVKQSEPTLGATEQALAIARVKATATRAYFETQEALCVSLTREECASLGGHSYNVLAVGRDTGKCTYGDRPTELWREITFGNGQFKLVGYTGEDYDGHTRIAENTYQWVSPDGKSIEMVTFTFNGQIVVSETQSGDCIWDITYTFKE